MISRTSSVLTCALAVALASPACADVGIEIAASGHATVPVEGDFGAARFVFDTGAEGTAVYEDFAAQAGLEVSGSEALQGQTGTADVALVTLAQIVLDGTAAGPVEAVRLPRRADGVPLAGIVGLDVFGGSVVDFDLPARRLAVYSSGTRPAGLSGEPLMAAPSLGNLLTVPVVLDGVEAVAVIDTGARKTRINWALGRLLGFEPGQLAAGDTIQGATLAAVETGAAHVREVRLGARVLSDASVLVADLPVFEAFGVADRPAVILGMDWLDRTRLTIDFPARLVWFIAAVGQGGSNSSATLTDP